MERNIHAYDEDVKWQLAEPGALMSAKNYRDKKALPLVGKLKEVVKNLTIKCVQLTEQSRKLTAKVDGQTVRCVGEVAIESTTFILALFQFDGLLLPCVEHIEHGRVSGIVGLVKAQADFPVSLPDFQPVHIFQRKERVHKPNKVSISGTVRAWVLISKIFAISFTRSCFGVLASVSYCAIRASEVFPRKPRISPNCFCVMPFQLRKKRIRLPIAIIKPPL